MQASAIECRGLTKQYGDVRAVNELTLNVADGSFFGLLGPNGSGKTTTIHMLSTLARPTVGSIRVAGYDVLKQPVQARACIGLVFQESALDRSLTVAENLHFAGALYGLDATTVEQRLAELLDLFDLESKREVRVAALSGGMRRALDIARGVLHRPRVLFLDEPTIGLDIINRRAIWRFISRLRQEHGMSVLLTTHYLEEAEGCDEVAFLRHGQLIGQGQPSDLIRALGHYILEIETDQPDYYIEQLSSELGTPVQEDERLLFAIQDEDFQFGALQQRLQHEVRALQLRKPDLNDVYIWRNQPTGKGEAA
ncbi:ABC-2 type transport system ATP-binding protein [Methylohalomonas lacus]|uniref:ABC-2 type transport system ATP-binding protein n=1 Tax=Methylohalomonas lacus TaxID=398773 RepID=A0AAE3HHQ1_9GAMM|nr:ATP-binding cassette domain-containing protein [Methylohalomonas lacus]MCS3902541.1 ABC-2 type transport system ATP-binding protein [Methylohalomonas lacus]